MLNHTEDLSLDSHHIESTALLEWYGIKPPASPISYASGKHWISEIDRQLYFNELRLDVENGPLVGALSTGEVIVAAQPQQLLLLTEDGELIEQIGTGQGIPGIINRVGLDLQSRLVLQNGEHTFYSDEALLEWFPMENVATVNWANADATPVELQQQLFASYRGDGLSVERVLLDLHSGRLFGRWGVYFMDAVAVIILLLATAGIWIWARRKH